MSESLPVDAAESPSGLVARARNMLKERGAPMSAENLNRAMLMMRGGADDGFINDVASNAAEGRNTPSRRAVPSSTPPTAQPQQVGGMVAPTTVQEDLPAIPGAQTRAANPIGVTPEAVIDPLTGAVLSDVPPTSNTVMASPRRGQAQASTIAPNGGSTAQSDPGSQAVTGPAAGGPGSVYGPTQTSSDRGAATLDRTRRMLTEPESMSPADRSILDIIMGMQSGGLRTVRSSVPGATALPNGSVNPPGPPAPQLYEVRPTERMNMPAQQWANPPPPGMVSGPSGTPSMPSGPSAGVALPNARIPTMLEPPPATAQVSGPPTAPRIANDPYFNQRQQSIELGQELRRRGQQRGRRQQSRGDTTADSR